MGVSPQHVTLVASTVATVTLSGGYGRVEVLNVDGTAAVYFTVDGTTPAVAQDGCLVVPAAIQALTVPVTSRAGGGDVTVKLISGVTPKVSVRGVS